MSDETISREFTGESVQAALEAAAAALGRPVDSIRFDVVQKEKKGVFGLGMKEPARIRLLDEDAPSTADLPAPVLAVRTMVELLSPEAEIRVQHPETDKFILSVQGGASGQLIGRGGQNLQALQTLVNAILHRHRSDLKVMIDVDHYFEKKERQTMEQAHALAEEVLKTGRDAELPPLNPFERRLVHLELSKIPGIATESLGDGRLKPIRIYAKSSTD